MGTIIEESINRMKMRQQIDISILNIAQSQTCKMKINIQAPTDYLRDVQINFHSQSIIYIWVINKTTDFLNTKTKMYD